MGNPELEIERLKAEKADLYERKRETERLINAHYSMAKREALDGVKYTYLKWFQEINEQISWNRRRITHPNALPMICDLDQVKAERLLSLVEAIFGEKSTGVPSAEVLRSLREKCLEVMRTLSRQDQAILFIYFALDGGPLLSLRKVGDRYGLSGDRIMQLRNKALRRMRHPSRSRKLKDYLG